MLVKPGPAVDLVVVVKPQTDPFTTLDEVEENLVLAERSRFNRGELDTMSRVDDSLRGYSAANMGIVTHFTVTVTVE
ncbi:hypothetical protein [Botrimarina mediterranea]|uniref:hypothetical protein n=1 Tax=Botrimarina mediterranea TaxID=2528022 RepID=UPI0018D4423C|nr:hypothetical protein [Botrimarina mediterranea]